MIRVSLAGMLAAERPQQPLCPAGCGRRMLAGALLCAEDWARLPTHQQNAVLTAWRAYVRGPSPAGVDAYLAARADALDALGAGE